MKRKSWKAVASALFEALAECDWSFGRAQEDRVALNLHAAQIAYEERAAYRKPRRKLRKSTE